MLIIFDYDGTLADTFKFNYKITKQVVKKNGLNNFRQKDFIWIGTKNPFKRFQELGLSKKQIQNLILTLQKESIIQPLATKIFPQIKDIIQELAQKNNLAIITSNSSVVVKYFLKKHKLSKYFKNILGADQEKSKVKKIKKVIRKYRADKNNVYYIGDTVGDILEAKKIGVKIIAISWGYSYLYLLKKSKPDFLISKPQEILKIIDKS